MNAVDTNIIVYSVDADAADKRVKALRFLGDLPSGESVLLWQVACEVGSVLTKFSNHGRASTDPETLIAALSARFRLVVPSEHVVIEGLRIRRTHQVSYWDALLIAACVDAGVTRLYTEDIQGMPVIEGVEVVNPLV